MREGKLLNAVLVFGLAIVAFVPLVFAQEFPYTAEVVSEKLNIRAGQNENFEKVGKLKKGDRVVVVEQSYAWNKIKLPADADSFIAVSFVQDVGDGLGMTKGDRVNIRAGRGTNYAVIGSLKKRTLVRLLEQKDGWARITPIEGIYGWVSAEYLRFVSKEIPPPMVIELQVKKTAKALELPDEGKAKARPISLTGIISSITPKITDDIQYQAAGSKGEVYFLRGDASILGNFLDSQVEIEGSIQQQLKLKYPVLRVTKIKLLM